MGLWPSGVISPDGLVESAPFMAGMALEFIPTLWEILSGRGGVWGPVGPVWDRKPDRPGIWTIDSIGMGSVAPVPPLPWLDVDECLPFGGGGYGDDLWLVLDYRNDPWQPRVVANRILWNAYKFMIWVELAGSFGEFWRKLGIPEF